MERSTAPYDNAVIEAIYERRAVRKFKDAAVDKQLILKLLDAARMSSSAMNHQPWHFYIVTDRAKIARYAQAIMGHSKLAMLKAGAKEAVQHILHPATFHLKDAVDFFKADDPIFHGAPVVIFISYDKSNDWAQLDVGMCAQNIMLAAKSLGLDTCPVGFAKFIENTEEYKELTIPSSEKLALAIIVGYGDETPIVHERKKDNDRFL